MSSAHRNTGDNYIRLAAIGFGFLSLGVSVTSCGYTGHASHACASNGCARITRLIPGGRTIGTLSWEGQGWTDVGSTRAASLRIVHGRLTNASKAPGSSAGYAEERTTGDVRGLSARFSFSPGRTDNGAVALVVWTTDLARTYPVIPSSPCHLVIGTHVWEYGIWIKDLGLTVLKQGNFASPLVAGQTYTASVAFTGATARVRISNSDGSVALASTSVVNPLIGRLAGPYATFEVYALRTATDSKAAFLSASAVGSSR